MGHINNVITPDTSLLRVMLGILMSSGEGGTQLLFYLAAMDGLVDHLIMIFGFVFVFHDIHCS